MDGQSITECFRVVTTRLHLSLAPRYTQEPLNGIKIQHLDPMIMNYMPKAGGVVVAYSNVRLSKTNKSEDSDGNAITIARIEGSSPFTFMWVAVDFLIWKPEVGDTLEGYIYMQTASHIGLLIHDTFNASIKKYNIPQDWIFNSNQEDEYLDDTNKSGRSYGHWTNGDNLKVEGKLKFAVKSIHTNGRMISIDGTLIQPGSEKDAQPVLREKRPSVTQVNNKHTKFADEVPETSVIASQEEGVPMYIDGSGAEEADEAIINNSSSEEEKSS